MEKKPLTFTSYHTEQLIQHGSLITLNIKAENTKLLKDYLYNCVRQRFLRTKKYKRNYIGLNNN